MPSDPLDFRDPPETALEYLNRKLEGKNRRGRMKRGTLFVAASLPLKHCIENIRDRERAAGRKANLSSTFRKLLWLGIQRYKELGSLPEMIR